MSTFFEKLTGPRSQTNRTHPTVELASAKKTLERPLRRAFDDSKSTHIKVEAEESSENTGEEITQIEEEGELTVDIYDKGEQIVIQSTVAGVKPEDLDISITNDTVTIRGKREHHEEVEEKNYYYKELFWGSFSRSVILPEEIEEDLSEASLKHGLLTITLPKKRKGVVQKLKVKVT